MAQTAAERGGYAVVFRLGTRADWCRVEADLEIVAGAVGNLYDNLTEANQGVRDFLLFSIVIDGERWKWPAFNVADACICVGAITLALLLWRSDEPPSGSDTAPSGA